MRSYARKPIWSREGANVELVRDGVPVTSNSGTYGMEGFVYQELSELPSFPGADGVCHPVMGVWMIDGEPAGLGIREGVGVEGLITQNDAHFVPHTIGSHVGRDAGAHGRALAVLGGPSQLADPAGGARDRRGWDAPLGRQREQAVVVALAPVDDAGTAGFLVVEQVEVVADELHLEERVIDRHRLAGVFLRPRDVPRLVVELVLVEDGHRARIAVG